MVTNSKVFKYVLGRKEMVEIIKNLSLEKILNDVSQASPEMKQILYGKDPFSEDSFVPIGSLMAEKPVLDGTEKVSSYSYSDIANANPIPGTFGGPHNLDSARNFGKTIHIFPDTQLYKTYLIAKLISEIGERKVRGVVPNINLEKLAVVHEELQQGGIRRNGVIPAELYRGENSLVDSCRIFPSWANEEIREFYDVATRKFGGFVHGLFALQDKKMNEPNGHVAQEYLDSNNMKFRDGTQQAYHAMLTKLLQKRKDGNESNYVADKVLSLANFGVNFFSDSEKSIVLTADNDFKAIENFVYNTVLPSYLAGKSRDIMTKYVPYKIDQLKLRTPQGMKRFEDCFQQYLYAGLELNDCDQRQLTNVIYNCRTGETSVGYVHPMIRNFVFDKTVGLVKSYVAGQSILKNQSPKKTLQNIQEDPDWCEAWLKGEFGDR